MSGFRCTVQSKGIVRDKRCMRLIFWHAACGSNSTAYGGKEQNRNICEEFEMQLYS